MTNLRPSITAVQQRVIRVFVSSTFRDMQVERDELVKRIFPQLRKLCESRGVTWGEVDLRWGVTDEQKSEGKVLPICLAEIRRCRPYFIGLLGERYGWVPEEISPALVDEERWLEGLQGRSVTELEILHGVLNNSAMAEHTFFYFRSPAYLDSLPGEQRSAFRESSTAEDIAQFGAEEAARRAQERKQKLTELKERIRGSGLPVREDYADPRSLGELVLADLTSAIDRAFPEGSAPDPLDREAAEQEAFAKSRAHVYIGRPEYFDRLDAQARLDGPPLVVLGESGLGKSALLANWAMRYRAAHPDDLLVQHYIGATPASADWAAILRRILGELTRRFGLALEIPDKPDALRLVFINALHMAAAKGRVILILDALNQLEDRDQAPDLVWLPPVIPGNVRLILSTLPGRALDDLKKRDWPIVQVEPLTTNERKQLVNDYLAQYTKSLSAGRVERIAVAPQTANPLYLRALLEELRLWHEHETLEGRIDHYLSAATVAELYQRILERYEKDYERDRPGLVRDAASLLWAARRGLSEAELLDLLGSNGQSLPRAHWSPFYLTAEQSLVSRSGLIGFFHNYFRQAVGERYLPTEAQQQAAHLRLAGYFEARELGDRKVDELPWQLAEGKAWERLSALLTDPRLFMAAWDRNRFEVQAYWAQIEGQSQARMVDAYRSVLKGQGAEAAYARCVFLLLHGSGHLKEAYSLEKVLIEYYRRTGSRVELAGALYSQAVILRDWGRLDEAMALLKDQERLCRELGNKVGLLLALGYQAIVLRDWGRLDEAMALLKDQERLCRELGEKAGLSGSLGNQALILRDWGRLDEAMALLKDQERLCRELGDKEGLLLALGNQALILKDRGKLDEAMALHKEEERLCRDLGDKAGLSRSLGNEAVILQIWGKLDEAMALLKDQERLYLELGDKHGLQISIGNQAMILHGWGKLDEAMALLKDQERHYRELGNKHGLQMSIGNQALVLQDQGKLDEAMALLKDQERLCRELGEKAGLSGSLGNQALILRDWGRLDEAMALLKDQERLCRELDDKLGLSRSIGNQALILKDRGELDEALALLKDQERLCRELGEKAGLSRSLANQALILQDKGRLGGAMALLKGQERLCRELGRKDWLQGSLARQAHVLGKLGDLDEAMALLKEQQGICQELGDLEGVELSLRNQARIAEHQMTRTIPHDAARSAFAVEYSRYTQALAAWRSLPFLERMRTKKPEPPRE